MTIVRRTETTAPAIFAFVASILMCGGLAQARVCGQGPDAGVDASLAESAPDIPAVLPLLEPPIDFTSSITDQQSSGAGQAGSSSAPDARPASGDDRRQNLSVNPLTGLVPTGSSNYQPLTGRERWRIYLKMNFLSVGAYFGPFFDALILDQATGSPAQWGGGFKGYGRRVASRTANAMLQGTIQAPVAAILHDDVRYITSTQRSFKRRALHAIVYSFLTYDEHGHPVVNVANLSAYYGATAISTLWLPGHYNWASYALTNSTEQIALTMPVNLLQEFWPEVRHYALHRQ